MLLYSVNYVNHYFTTDIEVQWSEFHKLVYLIKCIFRSQDLWSLAEKGIKEEYSDIKKKEEKDALTKTRKKDQKALFAIF